MLHSNLFEVYPGAEQRLKNLLDTTVFTCGTSYTGDDLKVPNNLCAFTAINLALTGRFSDVIPDACCWALSRWLHEIEHHLPAHLLNADDWKAAIPLLARCARTPENDRKAVLAIWDWLWETVLPNLQVAAEHEKIGEAWAEMCRTRTLSVVTQVYDFNAVHESDDSSDDPDAYKSDSNLAFAVCCLDGALKDWEPVEIVLSRVIETGKYVGNQKEYLEQALQTLVFDLCQVVVFGASAVTDHLNPKGKLYEGYPEVRYDFLRKLEFAEFLKKATEL